MKRLIVAIDGPTAAGKSTAGRGLAARLGYLYIDTGAMYRAVAYRALEEGIDLEDPDALSELAERTTVDLQPADGGVKVLVHGRDVTSLLRTPDVDRAASKVSTVPGVRAALVGQQRRLGRTGGVVMDGRDIGTHVFPDADVKFFLLADSRIRAGRRHEENAAKGRDESLDATLEALEERDRRDASRLVAPLVPAPDAVVLDSSTLSRDAVLEKMLEIVTARL
jgi:cytidylate kinase